MRLSWAVGDITGKNTQRAAAAGLVMAAALVALLAAAGPAAAQTEVWSATPPSNETDPPTKAYLYFPHIVDSAWWSTQFILFNRFAGQTSYGALSFIDANGESWILPTTQP